MPELPDVEGFRKYFDETSLNKKIVEVDLSAPKMLKESKPADLQEAVTGQKFISTLRHGKYMFAELTSKKVLMLHFGMTGFLHYYKDPDDASRHIRMQFKFQDGSWLAYDNARRFGQIMLADSAEELIKKKKLGPDPITSKMKYRQFAELLEGKSGTLKSILMDQSVIAGIGNLYSDEIAYRSGLHPSASFRKINEEKKKEIFKNMLSILKKAIMKDGETELLPKDFLVNHREEGDKCPICGGEITHSTVAGRTSYFCKKHQKKM